MNTSEKIGYLSRIEEKLAPMRSAGRRIVHCHGVFDILHVGYIHYLQHACAHGDVLVVTVRGDAQFAPGEAPPAFSQELRAQALAALDCVNLIAICPEADSLEAIRRIRPDVFVRGTFREKSMREHETILSKEKALVESLGGTFVQIDGDGYSASSLINRHLDIFSPEATIFLQDFRKRYTADQICDELKKIRKLKVLTIGETIIDEYQFCLVMNKSNKEPILAAKHLHEKAYAGGILAIANHLADFCEHVGVLSYLGDRDSREAFVRESLHEKIAAEFITKNNSPTVAKHRILEEYMAVKLFEVYHINDAPLEGSDEDAFCEKLVALLPEYDVVIVADYGHGLFGERSINLLCEKANFLAVNAQINAGNRGFNFVSKYPRADYVSIDEAEAHLEARDSSADIRVIIEGIARRMSCPHFMVTRGKRGGLYYELDKGFTEVPAFAIKLVDRIGAGDAFLALTAPCVAAGLPPELIAFIGNVAGAEACRIMGNERSIRMEEMSAHIASLLR